MLRNRILTSLVLLALVTVGLITLPLNWFIGVMGIIMLYAAWEWTYLIGMKKWWWRCLYLIILIPLSVAPWYIPTLWILLFAALLWLLLGLWVLVFPRGSAIWSSHWLVPALIGIISIFCSWVALVVIRAGEQGVINLFLLLLIVWSTDTGAYFIGKHFGKNKLAPQLSPNKTKEGFYGGFISALVIAVIYGFIFQPESFFSPLFALLVIITVLMSVIGDLLESMAKRLQGVKDSGQILPGHGGLLDRIDSLIAAAPIFALIIWLLR